MAAKEKILYAFRLNDYFGHIFKPTLLPYRIAYNNVESCENLYTKDNLK